jgi:hypothetical protein
VGRGRGDATRAAILLDVLLLDMALHAHGDQIGVTQGRTYMKDKHRGPTNDTWGIVHLLLRQQKELGYASRGDAAVLFARARRYRLPALVQQVAWEPGPFADAERLSWPITEQGPVVPDPEHPAGHSFEDTEPNFTFWWGLGAWTAWPVVPLTVTNGDRYNMWNMSLLQPFQPLRGLLGDPPDLVLGQGLAVVLWPMATLGLLEEVDTYTWKTQGHVLSSAQDWRPGANVGQVQAWQATFDSEAIVFTTHPMNPVQHPSEWIGRDEGEPGYWTGSASMPRSAQVRDVAIHVYSPAYPDGGFLGLFDYETETHAYLPQDHFDEVDQAGAWTFARHGDDYLALFSWRPTVWRDTPQAELALLPPSHHHGPLTRPFDLVAPGGADNVWIVECGSAARWGSFEAFRAAILAAPVQVTKRPGPVFRVSQFDVAFESPSQGLLVFGSEGPFTVRGEEVPLHGGPRMENPWVRWERGASRVVARDAGGASVAWDWDAPSRTAAPPGE